MITDFNTTTKDIFKKFDWFSQAITPDVQNGANDFLTDKFEFKLISVSKNMNALFKEEGYFVTKIKVNAQEEVYFRSSDKAVDIILENALGTSKREFNLNKITELEAKIITGFVDNLYNFVSKNILKGNLSNNNIDTTHLTFFIRDKETLKCGKVIFSFPTDLMEPQSVEIGDEKFGLNYFDKSLVEVNLLIGKTSFSVGDMKGLEKDDIVVLDNSDIHTMKLQYLDYEKKFNIAPNPAILLSIDNDEGEEMATTNVSADNLWDTIQVEMGAEFDKVKISLGELKSIEKGLVVDLASVYNNKITLKVEDKVIATGELVIVNDRYGVKIENIFTEEEGKNEDEVAYNEDDDESDDEELMDEDEMSDEDE